LPPPVRIIADTAAALEKLGLIVALTLLDAGRAYLCEAAAELYDLLIRLLPVFGVFQLDFDELLAAVRIALQRSRPTGMSSAEGLSRRLDCGTVAFAVAASLAAQLLHQRTRLVALLDEQLAVALQVE